MRKICRICKRRLTRKNGAVHQGNICRTCDNEYSRNLHRTSLIMIKRNGRLVSLHGRKRSRPIDDHCELCSRTSRKLNYHHWDDTDLMKGIWVCYFCHITIEKLDDHPNLPEKYFKIRFERSQS